MKFLSDLNKYISRKDIKNSEEYMNCHSEPQISSL